MKISLIGVPTYYGCDNRGTEKGPDKLREVNIIEEINSLGIEVNDLGNIYIDKIEERDKFKNNKNIKYFESIYSMNLKLAHQVDYCLKNGTFPLVLGGDHSIALGSITGASKHSKNLGVIWIDAHGDFNTEFTSPSKNSHGMSLACLCGYGNSSLINLYYNGTKIKEENVFHIGGRDIDFDEQILIDSSKVNMYTYKVIEKVGLEKVMDEIIIKCKSKKIDGLHISLDIDFMDKYLVEGTGTRVEGGYTLEDTKYILTELIKTGIVKSMDLVEFNPRLDINDKTLEICKELITHFSSIIVENELCSCVL